MIGNRKKAKEKVVRTLSERITERAIKKPGSALRELKSEPVNEVIRGEELVWKLPGTEYHRKCRGGHPRVNWIIETAKDVWERENNGTKSKTTIFQYHSTTKRQHTRKSS